MSVRRIGFQIDWDFHGVAGKEQSMRFMSAWRRLGCLCNAGSATLGSPMVVHFLVRGRVQGVGFRWFVHREASELELRGWVRNTEDGAVEVVAAGEPDDLSELRRSLHRGPRGSRVDQVIEHRMDEGEARELEKFRIEGAW
jgi:acylphosphatase